MLLVKYLSLIFLSYLLRMRSSVAAQDWEDEYKERYPERIRKSLLVNYDRFVRPGEYNNETTNVTMTFTIHNIGFDELRQMIMVHTWIMLSWTDKKLSWDTNDYSPRAKLVYFAEDEIWVPDIYLYNSASDSTSESYGKTMVVGKYNGTQWVVPPTILTSFCEINLRYWPFDTQTCSFLFMSWSYNADEVQILTDMDAIYFEWLTENKEWNILSSSFFTSTKVYESHLKSYLEITLIVKRNSPSYKAIVIAPIIVVLLLTLSCFWLPPQSGEKIALNCCSALFITLLLIYFSEKLPALRSQTSILVLFYSCSLYIVTLSTIGSVAVILISRSEHKKRIPGFMKWVLTGTIGKILFLDSYIRQASILMQGGSTEELCDTQLQEFEDQSGDKYLTSRSNTCFDDNYKNNIIQKEWVLVAAAIDRVSFCFYSLVFAVLAIDFTV